MICILYERIRHIIWHNTKRELRCFQRQGLPHESCYDTKKTVCVCFRKNFVLQAETTQYALWKNHRNLNPDIFHLTKDLFA